MSAILDILNPANTISANRVLANAIGLNEAIVYASLAAKSEYYESREMITDGWFFSTIEDLRESTTLSEKQQRTAIKRLVEEGLICCKRKGVPARRYFKVIDDPARLSEIINDGADNIRELKPSAVKQMDEYRSHVDLIASAEYYNISGIPSKETFNSFNNKHSSYCEKEEPFPLQKQNKKLRPVSATYKTKENKSKTKYNHSIAQSADMADMMDNIAGNDLSYLNIVKENIGYDYLCETCKDSKDYINEIALLMADVLSSKKKTIRVYGEDKPSETVKSVFLQLDESHIQYVVDSMRKNTTKIHNIRNYLITALYNARFTLNSFYRSMVNHNMYCAGGAQ